MSEILVTGGAGYIGSHTVAELIDAGHSVTVIDDLSSGFRHLVPEGATFVEGDFSDLSIVKELLGRTRFDAAIHLAALKDAAESVSKPLEYYDVNVARTIRFLGALVDAGVANVVFSSTAAVYGDVERCPIDETFDVLPANPYGWSKYFVERVLEDLSAVGSMNAVSLRYFNAAGADVQVRRGNDADHRADLVSVLVDKALSGDSFTINGDDWPTQDGTPIRDLVHVSDLAVAHVQALEYLFAGGMGVVLNLGSESGFSVRQIAERVRELSGTDFDIVVGERREGDVAASVASASAAREILGWVPRYSDLDTVVTSALAWEHARRAR